MHRYLQNTISNLQTSISPWSRPRSTTLFWAFFLGMVYIFILQKIGPERDRLQHFCTFALILAKFSAPMSSNFFLCKIWVITNSKSAANITWRVYWMRNRGLLLQTFCTLFTQLAILTYSAMPQMMPQTCPRWCPRHAPLMPHSVQGQILTKFTLGIFYQS